jgi:hypothetical protein
MWRGYWGFGGHDAIVSPKSLKRRSKEDVFEGALAAPIAMEHFIMPDREARNER